MWIVDYIYICSGHHSSLIMHLALVLFQLVMGVYQLFPATVVVDVFQTVIPEASDTKLESQPTWFSARVICTTLAIKSHMRMTMIITMTKVEWKG